MAHEFPETGNMVRLNGLDLIVFLLDTIEICLHCRIQNTQSTGHRCVHYVMYARNLLLWLYDPDVLNQWSIGISIQPHLGSMSLN